MLDRMKPINRRTLLKGGAAAAALTAFPGLGAFAADEADPASLKRAGATTTLNFRAWERYPASEIPGLNLYLDAHPGVEIEWSSAPYGRYRDRLIAEFVAETPLDVVQVPETELAAWSDSEWLEPLDDYPGVKEAIAAATPAARSASTGPDGKIYALPMFSDAFGFAYNIDALKAGGFDKPAKNLDELRTQMEAIKKAGVDEYPLSLAMKKQPGQFWSLWSTLYASGGDMFEEDGSPAFDKPGSPMKPILEWYVAAYNDWKIVGLEDLQRDWGISRTGIRSGTIQFGYMAQYALTEFNKNPDSAVKGKIHMALVPGLETNDVGAVGYAHSAGMAANAKDKHAAWDALFYFAGPGADGKWTMPHLRALDQGGRCPYPVVYDDPELQKMVNEITLGDTDGYLGLSKVVRAKQGLKEPWYSEWELYTMGQIQDVLLKNVTIDAAIQASADQARKLAKG